MVLLKKVRRIWMTLKITELTYNLVDPPYNFYGVSYILNDYWHVVYIPLSTITEELKTKDIVQIVCARLHAELDCVPTHVDRITKEMKREAKTRGFKETEPSRKTRLGEPWKGGKFIT